MTGPKRSRLTPWLLQTPALILAVVFFGVPALYMARMSVNTHTPQTLPVLMWLSLRSAATPQVAVASVVLSLSVFACLSLIMVWCVRQLRKTTR